ncbi:Uncharacterized conserved protein, DUF1697 family [Muriicola jejuensis]|uniref:DUF1697 domain-containing protein n=1 Tax=Muriicola jejuensis TaxID=504488 RepID=A0A6P0UKW7_9FLAO|nr:DUF1697 domain-containing protein [Muriicola jejuensis]NER11693.1 DUF1697 domain-containing protein [Muriicola jejuensis]SMP25422.1 Uncharacterized conserved protein, DUF1697 family [Muriicola jejuensis]
MVAGTQLTFYVALLRGINVSGRHKVPMEQLRAELLSMGYSDVQTLLNSGNVIFRAEDIDPETLRTNIARHLNDVFGFEIPTWVLDARTFQDQFKEDPFRGLKLDEDSRCYVTFLNAEERAVPELPFTYNEGAFRIISERGKAVCSVLDISRIGTADVMGLLEKMYGKGITTRNWNTVVRILEKLKKPDS